MKNLYVHHDPDLSSSLKKIGSNKNPDISIYKINQGLKNSVELYLIVIQKISKQLDSKDARIKKIFAKLVYKVCRIWRSLGVEDRRI